MMKKQNFIITILFLMTVLSVSANALFIDQEFRQYNYATQQPCYNSSNGERQALVQRADSNYGSNGARLDIYMYEESGMGLYDKNCFYYFYTDNPQITYSPTGRPNNTDYPINYACLGYSGGGIGLTSLITLSDFNAWGGGTNYSTEMGDYIAIAPDTSHLGVLECGGSGWTLSVDANHSGLGYLDATTYTTYYTSYINETEKNVSQMSTFDIAFVTYVHTIPSTNNTIVNINVENGTNASISHAYVGIDDGDLGSGFTNESGVVTFIGDNLSGSHTINVVKEGYQLEGYATYIYGGQTNNITITLTPFISLTGVNITVKESGSGDLLSDIGLQVYSDEFTDFGVTNSTGNLFFETPQGLFNILATDNRTIELYTPKLDSVDVPPNTIVQKLLYLDEIQSFPLKLNVTNTSGNALYGVKVDAQFIIEGESTIKYTNESGWAIFNFPNPEDNWTFVFSLAGYETKILSFDTGNYWQNVQMTPITDDTELYIFVKNQTGVIIEGAYVSLDTGQTGYTNPYGWIKIVNDSIAGTRTVTVTKGEYETEIDTVYVPLHSTINKTILLTPTVTPTSLKINITKEDNGNPVEDYYVTLNGQGFVNEVRLTGADGFVNFTDIPGGNYEIWLDKPLWRSYRYNVSIPPEVTTQLNYQVSQNEIAWVVDYYTIPPETSNGSYEVNISAYSEVEFHFNVTDENVESVVCLLYPDYDSDPSTYFEGTYDAENEEVVCSYIYAVSNITYNTRIWVVDAETRSEGWTSNPMYFDFEINIGGFTSESIMFEENFDYTDSIDNHGWGVFGIVPTPINNELIFTGSALEGGFIYHDLGDYGQNDFHCSWKQKNVLGNSHTLLFNRYYLFVEDNLDDDVAVHMYWYPPMESSPDYTDYETIQPSGFNSYSFAYLEADDISKVTSTVNFYSEKFDQTFKDVLVDNHDAIGQYDRLQYYTYTIYYDYNLKTYNIYQDSSTLIQQFGVHDPNMRHPDSIGFAIIGDEDYIVYIDDISCKLGVPEFVSDEIGEHGWRSDGSFDYSVCEPDENKYWCVFRNFFNWGSGNALAWVFSNIILVAVLVVLIILFAPLLIRRRK